MPKRPSSPKRSRSTGATEAQAQVQDIIAVNIEKNARVADKLLDICHQHCRNHFSDDYEYISDNLHDIISLHKNYERIKKSRSPDKWEAIIKKRSEELEQGKNFIQTNIIRDIVTSLGIDHQWMGLMEVRSLMSETHRV